MAYAIEDHDGYEGYATADLTALWPSSNLGSAGATVIGTSPVPYGYGQSCKFTDSGAHVAYTKRTFPTGNTFSEFALGFNLDPANVTVAGAIAAVFEGSTVHLDLRVTNGSGAGVKTLYLTRNGTTLATFTDALVAGAWSHVILCGKINSSTGYYYVYVNGALVGSGTSQNTQNGGTGAISAWSLGTHISVSSGWYVYIDDAYICSVTSGPDHPGQLREAPLVPSGAGNYAQFTPSAGSNYQNVDETGSDGDTTYNSSTTTGNKDTFTVGSLPSAASVVLSVRQVTFARKDEAGARTLRQMFRISATDYEGGDVALGDTYTATQRLLTQNPNTTSAWTQSDVEGMEIGYKDQA